MYMYVKFSPRELNPLLHLIYERPKKRIAVPCYDGLNM